MTTWTLDDEGHARCRYGHRLCESCERCACYTVDISQGYPSGRVVVRQTRRAFLRQHLCQSCRAKERR